MTCFFTDEVRQLMYIYPPSAKLLLAPVRKVSRGYIVFSGRLTNNNS